MFPTVPVNGVVEEPIYTENIFELSYFDPIVFKYMFTLLKNLKVTVLFMNHSYQTKRDLYITLEELWKGLFNYMGIEIENPKKFEIIPQIDIL